MDSRLRQAAVRLEGGRRSTVGCGSPGVKVSNECRRTEYPIVECPASWRQERSS